MTAASLGRARSTAIAKTFGATVALDGVSSPSRRRRSMRCSARTAPASRPWSSCSSGLMQPDRGSIRSRWAASPVRLRQPAVRTRYGIQTAFQEMTLVRDLTVPDNMLLPYAPPVLDRHHPRAGRPSARWRDHLAQPRASTIDLERRDRRPRAGRPAEDRDRPRALPQAAHPAARRAHLDPGGPRRRLAGRDHRAREGATAPPSSSSRTACARCAPSATG